MEKSAENKIIANVSDEALAARTGKNWTEWFRLLDGISAVQMSHGEMASFLLEQQHLSPWWSQKITEGYEQERGLRERHQKADGYEISRSKTIAAPLETLYQAWSDDEQRKQWLPAALKLSGIRKQNPGKNIRFHYQNPESIVEVAFYGKSTGKCQVTVQHSKLKDKTQAREMKIHWGAALAALNSFVHP